MKFPPSKPPSKRHKGGVSPIDSVRTATRMMVAFGRQSAWTTETIRDMVIKSAKDAVQVPRVIEVKGCTITEPGGSSRRDQMMPIRDTIRMVVNATGLDVSDQRVQETVFAAVESTLEEALTRVDGDYAPSNRAPDGTTIDMDED